MSRIKYEILSLTEVIEKSNLVVGVEFLDSYSEEVPVVNRESGTGSLKEIPPFIKKGCVFNVKSVLMNTNAVEVPEKIHVPHENWRRSLSQHKAIYLDGPSKSYGILKYETEVKLIKNATILFLHHFMEKYEFTVSDSYEDDSALEKVTMIIENLR